MKKFKFKFESLMKVRVNERDLRRQLLSELQRRDAELVAALKQVEAERHTQLEDMRRLVAPGQVDVDGSAARRYYAGQLIGDLGGIERSRALLSAQIEHCRRALVKADQGVKALEKLADKARAELSLDQERRTARELEEAWRALHCGERSPC